MTTILTTCVVCGEGITALASHDEQTCEGACANLWGAIYTSVRDTLKDVVGHTRAVELIDRMAAETYAHLTVAQRAVWGKA